MAQPGFHSWAPSMSNITDTSATASWSPSVTSGATYEYNLSNSSVWTPTSATSASLTGLTASTPYTFKVRAKNSTGTSAERAANFNTGVETQNPTKPGIPIFASITSSGVNVSWSASTDNVAGSYVYSVYLGSTPIQSANKLGFHNRQVLPS